MTMENTDPDFYHRADAHISLANSQVTNEVGAGKVSASFMYGMARYCAFVYAANSDSKPALEADRDKAIEYFVEQFRLSFEENFDDYVANYEKYLNR
ncbi:DUF3144 domain-containing protein [Ferrimonas balearica]|uniref:DUF3144 domain-containing protein n=1 Tax=Ferrimonas balearica TaxID=44012 RepID=UPI001C93C3A7|nr:DUF3144 domain-containing protein [Ferrimonas balearica]MBY6223168.1 DUF3144 domain-containing protein [Ferrimonas balearica]